jgi:hypothetical protein
MPVEPHSDHRERARKNAYWCEDCRGYVVTLDVDKGVTPMFLACRVKGEPDDPANDCKGTMRSMMYPAPPWPKHDGFGSEIPTEPTWEWYEHVRKGGLLLRRAASDESEAPDAG